MGDIQEVVEQYEKDHFPDYKVPEGEMVVDGEQQEPFRDLLRQVVEECRTIARGPKSIAELGVRRYLTRWRVAIEIRRHFAWLPEGGSND